jgi:cytidylate kinase
VVSIRTLPITGVQQGEKGGVSMEKHWRCAEIEALADRQVRYWNLDRDARKRQAERNPPFPIITVSRQLGSGGCAVANALASKLKCQVYDRELVHEIAKRAHVSSVLVEELDERACRRIDIWLETLFDHDLFDFGDFRRSLTEVVQTIANLGPAVILGRGANFVPRRSPRLDVRVVAPMETRLKRLMERLQMDEPSARVALAQSDVERCKFTHRVHHADWNDLRHYDLVVDTGILSVEEATALVHARWVELEKAWATESA